MTSDYVIEKNVPLVQKNGAGRKPKYPLRQMEVGDSFVVPGGNVKSMRSAMRFAELRHGRKFKAQQQEGGVRVWRVE